MSLRPYKFQIVAVCQMLEDEAVVSEQIVGGPEGQPITVFGLEGLRNYADSFEEKLAEIDGKDG